MKKINNILFALFLSFAFITLTALPSFADQSCDEEAIKRDIDKSVEKTVAQMRSTLESYNRATKTFTTTCGEITQELRGKPLTFDLRTLQQALSYDRAKYSYLTDMSQYENTGIKWGAVPVKDEHCEELRVTAWSELETFNTLYSKAVVVFGIADRETALPYSCLCPEGSGTPTCTAYTNVKAEEQKTGNGCDTFATYLASLSSCPLCPIFQTVLNTDAKIADIAWRGLAKALRGVVMIFFLVFVAFETLKIVTNIAGSNMGSYLKSLFVLGAKVMFTYFLLDNSSYIYGYFVSPVIQAGLDMGTSLVSISSSQASVCLANNANVDFVSTPGNVLDASLLDSIMRTVRCYGHTATIMPAVGKGLICHGWANAGGLLPDFSMWFSGILFYLFGLMIWLVVSFYLVDCTVQLGMVCGLVPFLIACWPFKLTEKYSIKGIQLIMNTFFNYVMLGIVLLMSVEIVDFATGQKSGSMNKFMRALNRNNLDELQKIASLDGVEILVLVICCIFAFKLIENTNALADKFSKGAGMNIASKLGGLATGAAVSAVSTGGEILTTTGGALLDETGITKKLDNASQATKDFATGLASDVGKAIGLGKYQPGAGGDPTARSGNPTAGVGNPTQQPVEHTATAAPTAPEVGSHGAQYANESGNPTQQPAEQTATAAPTAPEVGSHGAQYANESGNPTQQSGGQSEPTAQQSAEQPSSTSSGSQQDPLSNGKYDQNGQPLYAEYAGDLNNYELLETGGYRNKETGQVIHDRFNQADEGRWYDNHTNSYISSEERYSLLEGTQYSKENEERRWQEGQKRRAERNKKQGE